MASLKLWALLLAAAPSCFAVQVSTLAELTTALSNQASHIIVAPGSGTISLGGTMLEVSAETVIEGNGVRLDAGSSSRILFIGGGNTPNFHVQISDVIFKDGSASTHPTNTIGGFDEGAGGSILVAPDASATIEGCTFEGSSAAIAGGALYAGGASITVFNSRFVSCSSQDTTPTAMTGTNFPPIEAGGGAIGVYSSTNFTCIDCSFESCTAGRTGGAIMVSEETGGAAPPPSSAPPPSTTIRTSTFTNCAAGTAGSTARTNGDAKGGAIALKYSGSASVYDSVISGCSAGNGGGVSAASGFEVSLKNVTIDRCTAENSGGGVFLEEATLNFDDGLITECVADSSAMPPTPRIGGGISSSSSILNVRTSSVERCSADMGGGMYLTSSTSSSMTRARLHDTALRGNRATARGTSCTETVCGLGGGIAVLDFSTLQLDKVSMVGNVIANAAGATSGTSGAALYSSVSAGGVHSSLLDIVHTCTGAGTAAAPLDLREAAPTLRGLSLTTTSCPANFLAKNSGGCVEQLVVDQVASVQTEIVASVTKGQGGMLEGTTSFELTVDLNTGALSSWMDGFGYNWTAFTNSSWITLGNTSGTFPAGTRTITIDLELVPTGLQDAQTYNDIVLLYLVLDGVPVANYYPHQFDVQLSISAEPVASQSYINALSPYSYPPGHDMSTGVCSVDLLACQLEVVVGETIPSFSVTPNDYDGVSIRHLLNRLEFSASLLLASGEPFLNETYPVQDGFQLQFSFPVIEEVACPSVGKGDYMLCAPMPLQRKSSQKSCDPAALETQQIAFVIFISLFFAMGPIGMCAMCVRRRRMHEVTVPEKLVDMLITVEGDEVAAAGKMVEADVLKYAYRMRTISRLLWAVTFLCMPWPAAAMIHMLAAPLAFAKLGDKRVPPALLPSQLRHTQYILIKYAFPAMLLQIIIFQAVPIPNFALNFPVGHAHSHFQSHLANVPMTLEAAYLYIAMAGIGALDGSGDRMAPLAVETFAWCLTVSYMQVALGVVTLMLLVVVVKSIGGDGEGGVEVMFWKAQCMRGFVLWVNKHLLDGGLLSAADAGEKSDPNKAKGEKDSKYCGKPNDLISGQPKESATGIFSFMGVDEAEIQGRMQQGTQAIIDEFKTHGTDVDNECLDYVLSQTAGSSDITFQNGWRRDQGREKFKLEDFVAHPRSQGAKLSEAHVVAQRVYTTAAFRSINGPLRDLQRDERGVVVDPPKLRQPHPMPVTVAFLYEALKRMRAVAMDEEPEADADDCVESLEGEHSRVDTAPSPADAVAAVAAALTPRSSSKDVGAPAPAPTKKSWFGFMRGSAKITPDSNGRVLWRGMRNLQVSKDFLARGGTELAPMSTTADLQIAVRYSRGSTSGVLIFLINAETFMQVGADLTYCSAFPEEKEFLYPPLTFLSPSGNVWKIRHDGTVYTVVEVEPQFPS